MMRILATAMVVQQALADLAAARAQHVAAAADYSAAFAGLQA